MKDSEECGGSAEAEPTLDSEECGGSAAAEPTKWDAPEQVLHGSKKDSS